VPGEVFEFDFSEAAAKLHEKNIIRQVGFDCDLSNISFYWYDQTVDFLLDMFYDDPRIFIKTKFVGY
jgi:hypothetical protein